MPDSSASEIPQVQDKRPKIAGLLPKNAQARVLGGIALVMVLVILFSGRKAPQERPAARPAPSVTAIDPSQERIQEYRARIEAQTQQLAAEEDKLTHAKQALGARAAATAAAPRLSPMPATPGSSQAAMAGESHHEPEKTWVEIDLEKREYQGRYASNIALTYRPAPASAGTSRQLGATETPDPWPEVAREEGPPDKPAQRPMSLAQGNPLSRQGRRESEPDSTKQYRLLEGTVLETVLTNRLDSSFSGPVNCMVTANVYSHDGQVLLIPQGTRVLGEVKKLESFGQQRLAVFFHRLIMPDGYSANLDQFQGLSQVGETGLADQVNHHYLQIFGVSVAIGAIAGLAQANTRYSVNESAADTYQQGVTSSLSQTSMRILDRYLNVLPTFTIREGHRVKVYLSQDLALPAYEQHKMPSDL